MGIGHTGVGLLVFALRDANTGSNAITNANARARHGFFLVLLSPPIRARGSEERRGTASISHVRTPR